MARRALEVADIFRAQGPAWCRARAGHVGRREVTAAIERCRTAALGGPRRPSAAMSRAARTVPIATSHTTHAATAP